MTFDPARQDLLLQRLPESRRYVVARDWHVQGHVVPMGFQTDGASIPRLAFLLVGGKYEPEVVGGAVLHDYLYDLKPRNKETTRAEADGLFRAMLLRDKAGPLRAHAMWIAVRAFGWLFW